MYALLERMNERQLPGLPLHFPSGPRQGSAGRRARALLGLQRRDHDPRADWPDHANGGKCAGDADDSARRTRTLHSTGAERLGLAALQRCGATDTCRSDNPTARATPSAACN